MNFIFILNSAALGVGLAMDAFSVSLANGLHEPQMHRKRIFSIAGVYAFFQYAMPMIGWVCVHTIIEMFSAFEKFIPWIALLLLLYIGGKMILEGIGERNNTEEDAEALQKSASGGAFTALAEAFFAKCGKRLFLFYSRVNRVLPLPSTRFPWDLRSRSTNL